MARPLHPYFQMPINSDGSLSIRSNLAIIVAALHRHQHEIKGKQVLLDRCEQVCNDAGVIQCRGNVAKAALQTKINMRFVRVTKIGSRKHYELTDVGKHLIEFAMHHEVTHLTPILQPRRQPE